MIGSAAAVLRVDYDDYLAIERRGDARHEYLDGVLRAMSRGTTAHSLVKTNVLRAVGNALEGKPDIIMLDNMSPRDVRACMEIRRLSKTRPLLEVSGGITLDSIEEYARTKIDMISTGSITSSVADIDMSLELI